MTKDIYSEITNRIIEELEQGIIPWNKPWTGVSAGAISHTTGRPYSILNQMLLQKPGEYITFNQCKKAGGSVKKGAKAKFVVFWKFMCKAKADENGDPVIGDDGTPELETYGILKYYNVFHIDDCEGISPKWDKEPAKIADVDENAEDVFTGYLHREGIRFEQEKAMKHIIPRRQIIFTFRCANNSKIPPNITAPHSTKQHTAPATFPGLTDLKQAQPLQLSDLNHTAKKN